LRTGYTFENIFHSEAAIVLGAEYNHFSYTWECLAHNPACLQPKYGVADVHATYIAPNGRLQFILAGSNVGNTEYSKLSGNNVRNFLPRAEYSFTVRYKY
ncbi:hypothetical protein, partial [Phenylobacterium sp.]|uniref:hypothetical protein n=1 Tax=Phenylobacterium sp. TaxID=1871053 RepID=UPI002E371927